jgi:hypothetical protein
LKKELNRKDKEIASTKSKLVTKMKVLEKENINLKK